MRWPAIERPSGVGSSNTVTRAATASTTPQFDRSQVGCAGDGTLASAASAVVSVVAMQIPPSRAMIGLQWISFWTERHFE